MHKYLRVHLRRYLFVRMRIRVCLLLLMRKRERICMRRYWSLTVLRMRSVVCALSYTPAIALALAL